MLKNRLRVLLVLPALICLALVAGGAGAQKSTLVGAAAEWTVPDCDRISGTNAITFTTDDGLSLAETGVLRQLTWTYGLAALDAPNTLLAAVWGDDGALLMRSEDAGCKWQRVGKIPDCTALSLTAGPGGIVYAWTTGNPDFYRIEDKVVTALSAPEGIYGLAVDPADPLHIRIGGTDCQLYESPDGGLGFSNLGNPAMSGNNVFFSVDFDPLNWDCALCGTKGAWRTIDGGENWVTVSPFDKEDVDFAYRFVYSPVDRQRVWARGKLETMAEGPRGVFVSDDGGANFSLAVEEGTLVRDQNGIERVLLLPNMPTMAAHPGNSDVVYFVSSNSFDNYGTDFFHYDLTADNVTLAHIDGLDDINAMAFNPVDPSVIYLGLEQTILGLTEPQAAAGATNESVRMAAEPNPFNPATELSFSLPAAAQVRLDIYNLAGQMVATVVDGQLNAGEHKVGWNAGRLPSGIYLARLQAGSFVATRSMVLLK